MVDLGLISDFFLILIGFPWKCRFWCIPTPDFCGQLPCRRLFLVMSLLWKNISVFYDFQWFLFKINIICHQLKELSIKPASGPYNILVGALNAWNDHPKVVPWPILFEKVVPKRQTNHHYFWVCSKGMIIFFASFRTHRCHYLENYPPRNMPLIVSIQWDHLEPGHCTKIK